MFSGTRWKSRSVGALDRSVPVAEERTDPFSPSTSVTLTTFLPSTCSPRDSVTVASMRMFMPFDT